MVFEGLEYALSGWLGDAAALGAASWLEVFAWLATLLIALAALISLRRQSLQSQAGLLFNLSTRWHEISKERNSVYSFIVEIQRNTQKEHGGVKYVHQVPLIRNGCHAKTRELKLQNSPVLSDLVIYLDFIETLGLYVRNGYIPYKIAVQLYKGPILDLEVASSGFIADWQETAHMPPGLFEHALYLMKRTRIREERPIFYRTGYQIMRIFRR